MSTDKAIEYHAAQHPCPTLIKGSGLQALPLGSKLVFSNNGSISVRRAAVITCITSELILTDSTGNAFAYLWPRDNFIVDSGDDFIITTAPTATIAGSVQVLEYLLTNEVTAAARFIAAKKK